MLLEADEQFGLYFMLQEITETEVDRSLHRRSSQGAVL